MDSTASDILRGMRGPTHELAVLGAGNYLAEACNPRGHYKTQLLSVDRNAVLVEGRGVPTMAVTKEPPPPDTAAERLARVRHALHAGDELFTDAAGAVRAHDLRDIAAAETAARTAAATEVLRFKVCFMEEMPQTPAEPIRARLFQLDYFTSDSSVKLTELGHEGAALSDAVFARRHVAINPDTGAPFRVHDFDIGARVVVYARAFTILDADVATRRLLGDKFRVDLPAGLPTPRMPGQPTGARAVPPPEPRTNSVCYDVGREEDATRGFYRRAGDTRKQFLEADGAKLTFEAEWREVGSMFGDRRRFTLQYYLADDTLEMLDRNSTYTSGGVFSTFLARTRVPRLPVEAALAHCLPLPSTSSKSSPDVGDTLSVPPVDDVRRAVLAAHAAYAPSSGSSVRGKTISPITGAPIYQPPNSEEDGARGPDTLLGVCINTALVSSPAFISAGDLVCGGAVSIFGRPLLLRSCDPFTVAFGLHKLGFDQRATFVRAVQEAPASASPRAVPLPPHVGPAAVGSEEETRMNATRLVPTYRATKDASRLYQLGGKVLRFDAVIDAAFADPSDARRAFIVSFFLEDDTMSITELVTPPGRTGAAAPAPVPTRWLQRGRYRNAEAELEASAARDMGVDALGATAAGASHMSPAAWAAADRLRGALPERMGYTETSGGQGYGGGLYGKSDRVGPGGVGVAAGAELGAHGGAVAAASAMHRYFTSTDMDVGAVVRMAHVPRIAFRLVSADPFTRDFLDARAATPGADPKDVYVPPTRPPAPVLPVEGALDASSTLHAVASSMPSSLTEALLVLAKILAGVTDSALTVVRGADRTSRGFVPRAVMEASLREYGVQPPLCPPSVVDACLDAFAFTLTPDGGRTPLPTTLPSVLHPRDAESGSASARGGGAWNAPASGEAAPTGPPAPRAAPAAVYYASARRAPARSTSVVGTMDDPLAGPFLRDYGAPSWAGTVMVDYRALFGAMKAAASAQTSAQPRADKLLSQLRTAVLSNRAHLRKVFRDLDTEERGVITFAEFRHLLKRHNLDTGVSDAELRVLMSRFPAAPAGEGTPESPAISWHGFVEVLLDAQTQTPQELAVFMNFVRGVRDTAPHGVGGMRVVPAMRPHTNSVSSWTPTSADPTPYLLAAGAQPVPPPRAPPARSDVTSSAPASFVARAQRMHAAQPPPPAAARPATSAGSGSASGYTSAYGSSAASDSYPASAPSSRGVLSSASSVYDAAALPPRAADMVAPRGGTAPDRLQTTTQVVSLPPTSAASGGERAPLVDPCIVFASHPAGSQLLADMQRTFAGRRFDLYRAMQLYDTARKCTLDVDSFFSALVSAGLKLNRTQVQEGRALLANAAAKLAVAAHMAAPGTRVQPQDVHVDYSHFFDNLWSTPAAPY